MGMMSVAPAIPGIPIPFDLDKELTPVVNLAGTPMALVVRPDAPFDDIDGLIAYAKARNGAATFASSGNGSINQLGALLFANAAGVRMNHISYRGGAPAVLDVSAGRVDMMVANVAEVSGAIRGGQLKALGVTAAEPTPLMPELPPLAVPSPPWRSSTGSAWPGRRACRAGSWTGWWTSSRPRCATPRPPAR